jgi:hypothetical protein
VDPVNGDAFAGWMPIRVYVEDARLMVDWCHVGDTPFTEPFFTDTVERRLRDPFALTFRRQTPIEALVELQAEHPGVPPAGFIYHMSRCGSTLVSQLLSRLPENVVLSEPAPIEGLLRAMLRSPDVDGAQWVEWLRALVGAMARPRTGAERRCFVKFDTWEAMALPLIRRAFPEVPWVFLHRDPVEVLVSHERSRGAQMLPGPFPPGLFGIAWGELGDLSVDEYGARVLGACCEAALGHLEDGGLAVAYRDLPEAAWTSIADHFGLRLSARDMERMRDAAGFDAKRPDKAFVTDSAAKRAAASTSLRDAAERWVAPVWSRLKSADREAASATVGGA